ncbi:piggyBac transposable element-derived protein 4-like [Periplaneta americana]|uniref:piggyBac transposable element-derived protein 4-like n=1 Tax=Periplaneta americana TaxID=6978 RepID=UPI0037E70789
MNKGTYDFQNAEDMKEVQRLIFDYNELPVDDNFQETDDSDSEDKVESRSVDSDTDHEVDDENAELGDANYFIGKDGTKWKKSPWKTTHTRPHRPNILAKLPGVMQTAKDAETEFDCWKLFVSDIILDMIVENTNIYIENLKEKITRERDRRPTDVIEMKAFLGLLYLAGIFHGGHQNIRDFWTTDDLGVNIFRMAMSEKRFRFLVRCIRFDNKISRNERRKTDKLAAVREIFTIFVNNCKTHYSLGQSVTVDEQLLAFRGRCGFRQYIPSKPSKYGIKIFCLSDAKMFYTSNMEIYCGEQPDGPYQQENSADAVVLRLTEPIHGTGRNITADNWFTSLKLVKELEERKLSFVGTVRKNKMELPLNFTSPKGRQQYDSIFGFTENETLVSYVPKKGKTIVLLSSLHVSENQVSDSVERKPEIVLYYNDTKSGVDVVDKLCAKCSVARSTRRWPTVIFYHILNIAVINSRVIFLENKNIHSNKREYLKTLALSLLSEQLQRRALIKSLPDEIKALLAKHRPKGPPMDDLEDASEPSSRKRRRCQPCYKETRKDCRSKYSCEKCKTYLCLNKHAKIVCERCLLTDNEEGRHISDCD